MEKRRLQPDDNTHKKGRAIDQTGPDQTGPVYYYYFLAPEADIHPPTLISLS